MTSNTRAYVEQDLAGLFAGEVRYARDAFEGRRLMDAFMAVKRGVAGAELPALQERREQCRGACLHTVRRFSNARIPGHQNRREHCADIALDGNEYGFDAGQPIVRRRIPRAPCRQSIETHVVDAGGDALGAQDRDRGLRGIGMVTRHLQQRKSKLDAVVGGERLADETGQGQRAIPECLDD